MIGQGDKEQEDNSVGSSLPCFVLLCVTERSTSPLLSLGSTKSNTEM